jgi:hypothetical protein
MFLLSYDKVDFYMNKTQKDPDFKGVVGRLSTMILFRNQKELKESRQKICEEIYTTLSIVIYAQKNFWLLDALNEKIELFKSAGLMNFWLDKYVDRRITNVKQTKSPEVLTLSHLKGSFGMLLCGSLISFVVFLAELLIYKTFNHSKRYFST